MPDMTQTRAAFGRMTAQVLARPELIRPHWETMARELGYPEPEVPQIFMKILEVFREAPSEPAAAQSINRLLGSKAPVVATALERRAALIHSQVSPLLDTTTEVLDFGCGDGEVALLLAPDVFSILTYDVADYRGETVKAHLPHLTTLEDVDPAAFDVALVLTVLHHCDDPRAALAQLEGCPRLIIIESVLTDALPWATQYFIDWLYNRGMHPGASIPVPGNFFSASDWEAMLATFGYTVVQQMDLGVDIPIVPEHHWRFDAHLMPD